MLLYCIWYTVFVLIFLFGLHVCVYMYVCKYSWRLEEGVGSLRLEVQAVVSWPVLVL